MKVVFKIVLNAACFLSTVSALLAQNLQPFSIVKKSEKIWGFKDETGKMVIEPKYRYAEEFKDGIAKVWYKKNVAI